MWLEQVFSGYALIAGACRTFLFREHVVVDEHEHILLGETGVSAQPVLAGDNAQSSAGTLIESGGLPILETRIHQVGIDRGVTRHNGPCVLPGPTVSLLGGERTELVTRPYRTQFPRLRHPSICKFGIHRMLGCILGARTTLRCKGG